MKFIALTVILSLAFPAFGANLSWCVQLLTKSAHQDLAGRLNRRYRQTYTLKKRISYGPEMRFRIFRPFNVSGFDEFFPNGQLPPVTTTNRLLVKRMSREEGIQEIRRGLDLNEERAWLYVPSEGLWFYDSVEYATVTTVGGNAILRELLGDEFGEVEAYHTHPKAAMVHLYKEYLRQTTGTISMDRFKIGGALPSTDDWTGLTRTIKYQAKESLSKATGHVVHEFGVTSYRIRAFPYHDGHRDTAIIPGLIGWDLEEASRFDDLDPHDLIRHMARRAERRSTEQMSFMIDKCRWTPATEPRLIIEFKPWQH